MEKTVAQKQVLGKGLASLFPGIPAAQGVASPAAPPSPASAPAGAEARPEISAGGLTADTPNRDRHPGISIINIEEIKVNPYQPRRDFDEKALEELAASIRTNGVIQPLVVRRDASGGYQLIAGERRLRAATRAGVKQVPIVIRKSTDREALEIALVENIQRQDLNCIDEAMAYFQLMQEFSLTQEEVAARVGKERATVANFLRLLRLPEAIIDDLKRGILSLGHGKALLSLEDHELRLRARAKIVETRMSVRDAEALVEQLKAAAKAQEAGTAEKSADPTQEMDAFQLRLKNLGKELTRQWSTKVEVKGSENRGKLTFHYRTREDLDRILQAVQNEKVWGRNQA